MHHSSDKPHHCLSFFLWQPKLFWLQVSFCFEAITEAQHCRFCLLFSTSKVVITQSTFKPAGTQQVRNKFFGSDLPLLVLFRRLPLLLDRIFSSLDFSIERFYIFKSFFVTAIFSARQSLTKIHTCPCLIQTRPEKNICELQAARKHLLRTSHNNQNYLDSLSSFP